MRRLLLLLVLALVPCARAVSQTADERLRAQREELDRIRRERDSLRTVATQMQGRVHTLSDEVTNLHHQAEATARLVNSLDTQLKSLDGEVKVANDKMSSAQQEVTSRRSTLRKRLVDIYKRGPLFATEALLSAKSFGELVARYKYLHELAVYDRNVVRRVEDLHKQINVQRQLLVRLQDEFEHNRDEKAREEHELRNLEGQRRGSLVEARQSIQEVEDRLARIQRDEAQLTQLFTSFEETRRRTELERPDIPAVTTSTLNTSDFGKLDWPAEGTVIYGFGRAINPNNTAIRWNGIGIAAPLNTQVRAIAAGEVMVADVIGTYGLTVIVQHGGGDYSVYGSLSRSDVQKGTRVSRGQVLGAIGRSDPLLAPHLHFEIRPKGRATDPMTWLQPRR